MATKGYLIYNITQKHQDIFKTQIKAFINAFKENNVQLKTVDNLYALDTIKKDSKISFILFWDKDIALADQLSTLNIKVFNNVDAIRLCDDKALTYNRLVKHKINVPKTIVLPLTFFEPLSIFFSEIKKLLKSNHIQYPFVVKERCSSLGLGVYLISNEQQFKKVLKEKWERGLLIQEYINDEVGKDYRIYLINHKVVASVIRTNKYDFRSNVEQGGVMSLNLKKDSKLFDIAVKASKSMNLNFGAVDIVKNKNQYMVLEVNSNARTVRIDKLSKKPITNLIVKHILKQI